MPNQPTDLVRIVRPVRLADPVNRDHPLNAGRVAWWLTVPGLDGGRSWYDLMGLYPGTLANLTAAGNGWRPTTRPGGWGHVAFDGATSAGIVTASNLPGMASFSVAAWVWLPAPGSGYQAIIEHARGTSNDFGLWQSSDFHWHFRWSGSQAQNFSASAATGAWSRVLGTYDAATTTARMFLNGIADNVVTGTAAPTPVAGSVVIGSNNNGESLLGWVDDLVIWGRALSAAEVVADYDLSRRGYPGVLNRHPAPTTFLLTTGGTGNTATYGAVAQPAIVAYGATNVPPACAAAYAVAAQSVSVAYTLTNVPPAATTAYAATAQPATVSYGATNVPPAITEAYNPVVGAATVSYAATNTPPAINSGYAAVALAASVAYVATNTPPAGTIIYAAMAQPATVFYGTTNVPPAINSGYAPAALAASVAYAATNVSPAGVGTYTAMAQSATVAYSASNVPPARTGAYVAVAQSAITSYAATNIPPARTAAYAAIAQPATAQYALGFGSSYNAVAAPATVNYAVTALSAVAGGYAPVASSAVSHYAAMVSVAPVTLVYAPQAGAATVSFAMGSGTLTPVTGYISGSGQTIGLKFRDSSGNPTIPTAFTSGNDVRQFSVPGVTTPDTTTVSRTFTATFAGQTATIPYTVAPPSDYGLWKSIPTTIGRTYRVSGTWPASPFIATNVLAEIIQSNGVIAATHNFSQHNAPSGITDAGITYPGSATLIPWEDYGTITATGTTISIRITGAQDQNGEVRFDAIRVQDVTGAPGAPTYYDDTDSARFILHSDYGDFGNGVLVAITGFNNCYSGTYQTLHFGGKGLGGRTTIDDATAQANLQGLAAIGTGNISCSSNGRVEFIGVMGGESQPNFSVSSPATVATIATGGSVAMLTCAALNGGAAIPLRAGWIMGRNGRASSWAIQPLYQATPRKTLRANEVPMSRTPQYSGWDLSHVDSSSLSRYVFETSGNGDHVDYPFQGLQDGTYRIAVTFAANSGLSTAASFTIRDRAGNVVQTVSINQTIAPADYTDLGHSWKYVGAPFTGLSVGYWPSLRLTSTGNQVRIDAVQLVPDSNNAPSLIIPPGAPAVLDIPDGLITTGAGPVSACTIALTNHSGGSVLTPIDPSAIAMEVGYNVYFQSYANSLIQYSNLALKMDSLPVYPYANSGILAVNSDGYPTLVSGDFGVSMIITEPNPIDLGNGRGFLNAPAGLYTQLWSGTSDATAYGDVALVSEDLTGSIKKRIYRVTPASQYYAPTIGVTFHNIGVNPGNSAQYRVDVTSYKFYPPNPADTTGETPWTGTIPDIYPPFQAMVDGSNCCRFLDAMRGNSNNYGDIATWPTQTSMTQSFCAAKVGIPIARIEQGDSSRDNNNFLVLKITTSQPHGLWSGAFIIPAGISTPCQLSGPLAYGPQTSYPLANGSGAIGPGLVEVLTPTTLALHLPAGFGSIPAAPITMTNVITSQGWLESNQGTAISLANIVATCNGSASVKHCWINTASSATVACITAIGDYLAAHLRSDIKLHHEVGNENWNFGPEFENNPWLRIVSFQMTGNPNAGVFPAWAAIGDLHHRTMAASFANAGRAGDYVATWGSQQGGGISGSLASAVHALSPPGQFPELCVGAYFGTSDVTDNRQADLMTVEQDLDLFEQFIEDPGFTWTISDKNTVREVYPSAVMTVYEMSMEGIVPGVSTGYLPANWLYRNDAIHRHPRSSGIYTRHMKRLQDEGVILANQYHLGGDTQRGKSYSTYEYYNQPAGTGNITTDAINISDPLSGDSTSSQIAGAIRRWNAMINSGNPPIATVVGVLNCLRNVRPLSRFFR